MEATEDAVQEVLQESFDQEGNLDGQFLQKKKIELFLQKSFFSSFAELSQLEDLNTNRITRILTTDFPQYFAIVSRIRQEVHAIGPEGE